MRIIVFFDLPVTTAKQRRSYSQFRKKLLRDGFTMLQFSVYSRFCLNIDVAQSYLNKVKVYIPSEGAIRAMAVTERQYAGMYLLLGGQTAQEKDVEGKEMVVI